MCPGPVADDAAGAGGVYEGVGAAGAGAGAAGAGAGAAAAPPPLCFMYSSKEGATPIDLRASSC